MRTLIEPTEKAVMKALLSMYRQNRLAVVDTFDGELTPFTIKEYTDTLAAGRSLRRLARSKRK